MITFHNPGLLDPKAFLTFGLNVKPGSDSPIGFFGTGLKFAIATLLRERQGIVIRSGSRFWSFHTEAEDFRGQTFDMIYCIATNTVTDAEEPEKLPLGISTELGKNWKLWMAYRELWSNAKDEGGDVEEGQIIQESWEEKTCIIVQGEKFEVVHSTRGEFLLSTTPLWTHAGCGVEIHPGETKTIFYKGIKVYEMPKPSVFTYNLLGHQDLTEDRTLAGTWHVEYYIKDLMKKCQNDNIVEVILRASTKETFEGNFTWVEAPPDTAFFRVCTKYADQHGVISGSAKTAWKLANKEEQRIEGKDLLPAQAEMIEHASGLVERMGFAISEYPVQLVETLGPNLACLAEDEKIYITPLLLQAGFTALAGQLAVAFFQLKHGLRRRSEEMENALASAMVANQLAAEGVEAPLGERKAEVEPAAEAPLTEVLDDEIPF